VLAACSRFPLVLFGLILVSSQIDAADKIDDTVGSRTWNAEWGFMKVHLPFAVLGLTIAAFSQTGNLRAEGTFAAAGVSAREQEQILEAVEQSAFDTPESWIKELHVRRVDLGAARGLLIQGTKLLCGGTANCQIWIFRRANGKWLSMLEGDQAPLAESVQLSPMRTLGIKDLILSSNSSADRTNLVTYKFDGRVYRTK
jgi:hypothetical protein